MTRNSEISGTPTRPNARPPHGRAGAATGGRSWSGWTTARC